MIDKKRRIIAILSVIIITAVFWLFSRDRYIKNNIKIIEGVDNFYIEAEGKSASYPMAKDSKEYKLVSYGGFIVKVDNILENTFFPYRKKLTKLDMIIDYKKAHESLARIEIYQSNEDPQNYILYLNNVYWTKHLKISDLEELIK